MGAQKTNICYYGFRREKKEKVPAMKHIFIINPAAGKYDHTEEFSGRIAAACTARGLNYAVCVSEKPGDCRALARKAAEQGEEVRLYACGGDGTLNEVVNGAVGFENAAVTHFPGGSGNDAIKIFSEPEAFRELERLLDAEETRFDLIRCNGMYALNVLSVGLDARIGTDIARFKRLPLVSGKGAYVLSTIDNLFRGISQHYRVTLDGETVDEGRRTMICICNGRWYGGSFNPVPEAEPDDGLLEVLIVDKVNLLQVAGVIGKYQKGCYADYPKLIRHVRCRSLRIECEKENVVNVDGEALHTTDAQIELVPQAIRFFYPKGLAYQAHSRKNSQK